MKIYALKFPPVPSHNKARSYNNGCISEYLACHTFSSLGFKAKEALLGTYTNSHGKEKVVVVAKILPKGAKGSLRLHI